jgi:hypothetical protein
LIANISSQMYGSKLQNRRRSQSKTATKQRQSAYKMQKAFGNGEIGVILMERAGTQMRVYQKRISPSLRGRRPKQSSLLTMTDGLLPASFLAVAMTK